MAKKQKRVQTRAQRRQANRQRDFEKARELEELQDVEEPEDEPLAETETIEKEMDMDEYYMGPTSFEEMDAMKEAREQAAKVREVTWDTQDLVWNILNHPMKSPEEKAQAIQAVGSGFGARVAKAAKPIKKDLDVLVIESILAADKRRAGPFEFVKDFISKAKLTTAAENALDDSQFALVRGEGESKVRKYPIHDKAHIRNALARAAQQNDADAHAAMPKIRAAAKKMGIEMSMEKDRNAIVIEKDAQGDWRWIGWVSNNFIDWDGDIISEDAHKEYVEWVDKNKDLHPVFLSWHTPETARQSPVDFAAYENGFLIMSGKLTESETESLLKAKALTDIGMSHGTLVLERDPNDSRIITKYRMYECSDLPLENAANPFTDFETISKEVDMDKQKYLAELLGEDRAKAFMEKTGMKQKELQEAEIESKEKQEGVPAEPPATPKTPATEPTPPQPVDQKALVEAVIKEIGAEELSAAFTALQEKADKVDVLEALVKELQGETEEKLAEMLTPPASRFAWMQKNRASQSKETELKEEDEKDKILKNKAPGVPEGYWLSEATGTTPVQVQ